MLIGLFLNILLCGIKAPVAEKFSVFLPYINLCL
jgi:hypothetical protein